VGKGIYILNVDTSCFPILQSRNLEMVCSSMILQEGLDRRCLSESVFLDPLKEVVETGILLFPLIYSYLALSIKRSSYI